MMINRAPSATSQEFLHCFATNQEQQQQQKPMNDLTMLTFLEDHHHHHHHQPPQAGRLFLGVGGTILDDFNIIRPLKPDPGLENYGISRTTSCPPVDKMSKGSFRKRKPDNQNNNTLHHSKGEAGEANKPKKVKGSSQTNENNCITKNRNKESKIKEDSGGSPKQDYIHVRARRGQATDSHSLAERVRREKISERMKYLQDLVPGCNKITGKAGMLDEIINYVQSLQRQVEFLSMKLAAVSPSLDLSIDDLFPKEAFPICSSNDPAMEITNLEYLQYTSGLQTGQVCGSNLPMSQVEMGIRRTISEPISIDEPFPDPSSLTQMQSCLPWGQADLQGIYSMEFEQASQQSFPSYTGLN